MRNRECAARIASLRNKVTSLAENPPGREVRDKRRSGARPLPEHDRPRRQVSGAHRLVPLAARGMRHRRHREPSAGSRSTFLAPTTRRQERSAPRPTRRLPQGAALPRATPIWSGSDTVISTLPRDRTLPGSKEKTAEASPRRHLPSCHTPYPSEQSWAAGSWTDSATVAQAPEQELRF